MFILEFALQFCLLSVHLERPRNGSQSRKSLFDSKLCFISLSWPLPLETRVLEHEVYRALISDLKINHPLGLYGLLLRLPRAHLLSFSFFLKPILNELFCDSLKKQLTRHHVSYVHITAEHKAPRTFLGLRGWSPGLWTPNLLHSSSGLIMHCRRVKTTD